MGGNDAKLFEFIKNWKANDWKKVKKLYHSGYVIENRRDSTGLLIQSLIDSHIVLKRKTELSLDIFSVACGITIQKDEWYHFTSEVLKVCYVHTRCSLLSNDAVMHQKLALQQYFMEHSFWANHDALFSKNHKSLYAQPNLEHHMLGFFRMFFEELRHSDIRNKEHRQNIHDFNEWRKGQELFYHENLMRLTCSLKASGMFKKSSDLESWDYSGIDAIPRNIRDTPQIKIYHMAYEFLHDPSPEMFNRLRTELNLHFDNKKSVYTHTYLEPIYIHLLNHCVQQVLIGNESYRVTYIDICIQLLQQGLLTEQNHLSSGHYKNLFTSYIKLNQKKKAIQFKLDYGNKLVGKKKNPVFIYCEAYEKYYDKNYEEVFRILSKSRKIYQELDDFIKMDLKLLFALVSLELNKMKEFNWEIRNIPLMNQRSQKVAEHYNQIWGNSVDVLKKINDSIPFELEDNYDDIMEMIRSKQIRIKGFIIDFLKRKRSDLKN